MKDDFFLQKTRNSFWRYKTILGKVDELVWNEMERCSEILDDSTR